MLISVYNMTFGHILSNEIKCKHKRFWMFTFKCKNVCVGQQNGHFRFLRFHVAFCPDEFETEIAVVEQKAGPLFEVNGNSHDHYHGHITTANQMVSAGFCAWVCVMCRYGVVMRLSFCNNFDYASFYWYECAVFNPNAICYMLVCTRFAITICSKCIWNNWWWMWCDFNMMKCVWQKHSGERSVYFIAVTRKRQILAWWK